jgi:alanine racemase
MRALSSLHINLAFLSENLQRIYQDVQGKKIIPMVKANAYGHGMEEISLHIQRHHQELIDGFGVATLQEGIQLRRSLGKSIQDIYVFSELEFLRPDSLEMYTQYSLIPVLSSLAQLDIFLTKSAFFKHVPMVLKFDTGMKRLGFEALEMDDLLKRLKLSGRKSIAHCMTHLACSDDKDHPLNHIQIEQFKECLKCLQTSGFSIEKTSIANSGAITNHLDSFCSHVRPGIRLYAKEGAGRIISSLETEVMAIKELKANSYFGYSANVKEQDGYLAMIPLGYADGLPLAVKGFSFLLDGNIQVEASGRTNMDILYLWSRSKLPWKVGSRLALWSDAQNNLNPLAKHIGAHVYQVLTGISYRIPRRYHSK